MLSTMNALTQMLSSHVFSTFVPANDCSLFNFLFILVFYLKIFVGRCHVIPCLSIEILSLPGSFLRVFVSVCSRRFSTTISSSGPSLSCSKSVVMRKKNRKSKKICAKPIKEYKKYNKIYWNVLRYTEIWWNVMKYDEHRVKLHRLDW